MKTNVMISGQMRSFDLCWPNQYWMVYRHLDDPHFYVSVADDEDAGKAELLWQRFEKARVHIEVVKQPELPEPKNVAFSGPYGPSSKPQAILRQFWHLNRVWEPFRDINAIEDGTIFLRIRPDLWFHFFEQLPTLPSEFAATPWWSRWGGVNDRIAVLGRAAAQRYFTTFERIDQMLSEGAPLHPESLLAESLWSGGFQVQPLQAWFSTVRKNGTAIPPDPQAVDIVDMLYQ